MWAKHYFSILMAAALVATAGLAQAQFSGKSQTRYGVSSHSSKDSSRASSAISRNGSHRTINSGVAKPRVRMSPSNNDSRYSRDSRRVDQSFRTNAKPRDSYLQDHYRRVTADRSNIRQNDGARYYGQNNTSRHYRDRDNIRSDYRSRERIKPGYNDNDYRYDDNRYDRSDRRDNNYRSDYNRRDNNRYDRRDYYRRDDRHSSNVYGSAYISYNSRHHRRPYYHDYYNYYHRYPRSGLSFSIGYNGDDWFGSLGFSSYYSSSHYRHSYSGFYYINDHYTSIDGRYSYDHDRDRDRYRPYHDNRRYDYYNHRYYDNRHRRVYRRVWVPGHWEYRTHVVVVDNCRTWVEPRYENHWNGHHWKLKKVNDGYYTTTPKTEKIQNRVWVDGHYQTASND